MQLNYRFNRLSFGDKLTPQPINLKYSNVGFLKTAIQPEEKLPHGILIVVKSAIKNVEKREGIRKTWGSLQYLRHPDTKLSQTLPSKLVFICGVPANFEEPFKENLNQLFPQEWKYNDIVVANFVSIINFYLCYKVKVTATIWVILG